VYVRHHVSTLRDRLAEPRRFIQAVVGPRQVGKSTIVRQALEGATAPVVSKSADGLVISTPGWISDAWAEARSRAQQAEGTSVLVIDEVQKIRQWSEEVKANWDADARNNIDVRLIILGSSTTLLNNGLRESLAGRFEIIRVMPWHFAEMQDAFGFDLHTYALYGGYPGSAPFITDPSRWRDYMVESVIQPLILRDIVQMQRIDKPALLHELLFTAARMSGREMSFTKLMNTLTDAGNTSTITHYLDTLEEAGLVAALPKQTKTIMKRRSSPKLQVFANGIATACDAGWHPDMAPDVRGRCYESLVGTHLLNSTIGTTTKVRYWRDGNSEVDFVLTSPSTTIGIEVSTSPRHNRTGLADFHAAFPDAKTLLVGEGGFPLADFLRLDVHRMHGIHHA
jgi:uncharacterized protein